MLDDQEDDGKIVFETQTYDKHMFSQYGKVLQRIKKVKERGN
jgi:hypothetical protein